MKISSIGFDESTEPLLAKVVKYLRRQGTLQRVQKQALIAEAGLDAVFHDPNSTPHERLSAIALVKSNIAAKQSMLDLMERWVEHDLFSQPPAEPPQPLPAPKATEESEVDDDDDLIEDNY